MPVVAACSSGPGDSSTTTAAGGREPIPVTTDPEAATTPSVDDSAIARAVLGAWVADRPESAASAFSVGISRVGADPAIAMSGERDGERVDADDWFRLGSVTKTYIAVALLRLVDDGRLDLDVPVATYTDAVPAGDRLTTRQLLTHTSGLGDYLANPEWFESVSTEQDRAWTPADVLSLVDADEATPGSFSYSNTNYVGAGLVLEAITELPVRDAVDQLVLAPSGLASTDMTSDGHDLVDGVIDVGDGTFVDTTALDSYRAIETSAGAAGSISATPEDLLAFGRALLDGDLLSADTFADMLATTVPNPYGLGIANWELLEGGGLVGYGNYGEIPGYSAMLLVDPSSGLVLTATGSDDRAPVDSLAAELQGAVVSGVLPTSRTGEPIGPAEATDLLFEEIDPAGPGCSVSVRSDGAVVYANAWGQAQLGNDPRPLTPDTIFDVGSLTKQFTATAALLLADQGRLELDSPVALSVAGLPAWASDVTPRQLMHHTSGVPDYVELLLADGADLTGSASTTDALAALRTVELDALPGSRFEYSNSNYLLLGLAVEAAAGEALDAFLQRAVFAPVGLVGVVDPLVDLADKADSYVRDGASWRLFDSSWSQVGDGGLQTTPSELVEWASEYWSPTIGGAGIELARAADAVATGEADGEVYGAGIRISQVEGLGRVLAHLGSWEAFISTLVIAPEAKVAVAVACNAVEVPVVRDGLGLELLRIWTDQAVRASPIPAG